MKEELVKMCTRIRLAGLSLSFAGFLFLFVNQVSYSFNLVNFAKRDPLEYEVLYKDIKILQEKSKYDSAALLINRALVLVSKSEREYVPLVLYRLNNYYHLGQYDSMKLVFPHLEKRVDFFHYQYSFTLFYKALVISKEGKYLDAIELILEAIVKFEESENVGFQALAYNNLGFYFQQINELEKSKSAYLKSIALNKKISNEIQLVKVYDNLGSLLLGTNQLDSALIYYDYSSHILLERENYFLLAQNILNRGHILEKKGAYEDALKRFKECLSLSEREGYRYEVLISNSNIGNLARLTKDFETAERILNVALAMSIEQNLREEKSLVYQKLSWLRRDQNEFEEAYKLGEMYAALNDSLTNEKIRKESGELLAKYESEKGAKEMLSLAAEKLQFKYYLMSTLAGVLFLSIPILVNDFRKRKSDLNTRLIEKEKEGLLRTNVLKDQELSVQAAHVLQIQEDIQRGKDRFWGLLQQEIPNLDTKKKKRIYNQIRFNNVGAGLVEDFEKNLSSSYEDYFKILLLHFPDLKPTDLKFCAYLRLDLSTKEISEIVNKSVRTVETIRLAIRKKMNLSPTENLVAHLIKIEKEYISNS